MRGAACPWQLLINAQSHPHRTCRKLSKHIEKMICIDLIADMLAGIFA